MGKYDNITLPKNITDGSEYSGQYLATLEGLSETANLQLELDKKLWTPPKAGEYGFEGSKAPHYSILLNEAQYGDSYYGFKRIMKVERPQFFTDNAGNTIIIGMYNDKSDRFNNSYNLVAQFYNEGLLTLGAPVEYKAADGLPNIMRANRAYGSSADNETYNWLIKGSGASGYNASSPSWYNIMVAREKAGKAAFPYVYLVISGEPPSFKSVFSQVAPYIIAGLGMITGGVGAGIIGTAFKIFSQIAVKYASGQPIGLADLSTVAASLLPSVVPADYQAKIAAALNQPNFNFNDPVNSVMKIAGVDEKTAKIVNDYYLRGSRIFNAKGTANQLQVLANEFGYKINAADSNKIYTALKNRDYLALAAGAGMTAIASSKIVENYVNNNLVHGLIKKPENFEDYVNGKLFDINSVLDIPHVQQYLNNAIQNKFDLKGLPLQSLSGGMPGAATVVKAILHNVPDGLDFTTDLHQSLVSMISGRLPNQDEIEKIAYSGLYNQAMTKVQEGKQFIMPTQIPPDKQLKMQENLNKDLQGNYVGLVESADTLSRAADSFFNALTNPSNGWL
ncbi:MAG: hypothetical protein NT007_09540 [Candidatus Kapabacteria bacterium]|nr:hypothetical protein [Candidatus Kapabacteria bacterium]